MYGADSGTDIGAHIPDGGKIVGTDKNLSRFGHDLFVQVFWIEVGPIHIEGIAYSGIVDLIGIFLTNTGADGVKALGDLPGRDHHNVLRQTGVEGQGHPVAWNIAGSAEIGDIDPCVDARIRAARPGEFHWVLYHLGDGLLQSLLNRLRIFLLLPARPAGAVVAELESEIGHDAPPLSPPILSYRPQNGKNPSGKRIE